jgi:hypothetical protein
MVLIILKIKVVPSPKFLSSLEAFIFCDWKNTKKSFSTSKVIVPEINQHQINTDEV